MPATSTISEEVHHDFLNRFLAVRAQSERLCQPLETEDFVVQPVADVSPPKWHLAHTTWFFEIFVLVPFMKGYRLFHKDYPLLFNSYYVSAGDRWQRAERGYLTRPTVQEVFDYRHYVEKQMQAFLTSCTLTGQLSHILETGIQHEQQHQELLLYDIKYILGHNPLFPAYRDLMEDKMDDSPPVEWLRVEEGNYDIGFSGPGFCFDNEKGRHQVHLHGFETASQPVNNAEYFEFMQDGGYKNHAYWLSDGWDWVNGEEIRAPLYWIREDDEWYQYTLGGLKKINWNTPVAHISYYEADAFAKWKQARLLTEFEWEVSARLFEPSVPDTANFVENGQFKPVQSRGYGFFGNLWEWTSSAYLAYPYYKALDGALGEYNGKFMVNQMVLRGGSFATPKKHIRLTYRNFFYPHSRWLFNGIRLARHV